MLPRRQTLGIVGRVGFVTLSLLIMSALPRTSAQDRPWEQAEAATVESEQLSPPTAMAAGVGVSQLETNTIIGATLCFAVGFGACLFVVHFMLPVLVHAQCVEIVRDYVEYARRGSDIRVVFLDRDGHQTLQRPRRVAPPVVEPHVDAHYESQPNRRVDRPSPSSGHEPGTSSNVQGESAPNSMLSQIYEQNLHLHDQMRKQSRNVKQ